MTFVINKMFFKTICLLPKERQVAAIPGQCQTERKALAMYLDLSHSFMR